MVRLIRLGVVALLLCAASPVLAGNVAVPAPAPTPVATSTPAPTAAPLSAEQALAIREAVDASEASLRADAYGQFQVICAFLGALITGIVIYFSFQSQRVAGAEAAKAAREEMAEAKKYIDALTTEAARATEEAKKATDAATEAAAKAAAAHQNAEAAATGAHQALGDLEADAAATRQLAEETAKLFDGVKADAESSKPPPLTREQVENVTMVTEASAATPEAGWSVDQFKTAIGKAMYVDRKWTEALRLATAMAAIHGANLAARLYALNRQGDAARELGRHGEALGAYQAAMALTADDPPPLQQQDYIWSAHHAGRSLIELGRAAEAEAMLRNLLPICERVDGPEASGTLVTRHELARAVLSQGRAAEAEQILIHLLPIRERINGAEATGPLVTRQVLASAVLNQGRAAEAETMLRALLPIKERVDGAENPRTLATRHELARAVLNQGRAAEAETMLRTLLPIAERVEGAEASNTLVTHNVLAVAILDQGRAAEAETMLRSLLPIKERVNGAEASGTLVVRHELARATLDQGRVVEAEMMLRVLVSIRERVSGTEAADTLATRHALARSVLDQGRAVEAEAILRTLIPICERLFGACDTRTLVARSGSADALVRSGDVEGARAALATIPDPVPSGDWRPRYEAALAFVRGRVADALGDTQAADAHLARAAEIFASIYPEDHYDRQKLKAYRDDRPAKKDAPDA